MDGLSPLFVQVLQHARPDQSLAPSQPAAMLVDLLLARHDARAQRAWDGEAARHPVGQVRHDAVGRAGRKQCPGALLPILEPMARTIASMTREINALDKRIEQLGEQPYGAAQRLRTADGVGPLTSLAYVLELNNQAQRAKRSRQMGALVGCRPKQRESGESAPPLGITKKGKPQVGRLLVQPSLRRWGLKLAARGGKRAKRRPVVAVARKRAVILHAMWLKQQAWQPFPGGPREPSFSGALARRASRR